jgi:hypothetical protein
MAYEAMFATHLYARPDNRRRGPSRTRDGAGPARRPHGDPQDGGQGQSVLLRGYVAQDHPRRGARDGAQLRGR